MVNFTILAGGFSQFIATYVLNNETATLDLVNQTATENITPSWIASHPQNSTVLYTTNEAPIGSVESFLVDADGNLAHADSFPTGNGPTFLSVLSTGDIATANFGGASATFVLLDEDDVSQFLDDGSNITFNAPQSNPHMILEHEGEVFVPDLGADKIWRLGYDCDAGSWSVHGQINIDAGSGPRHIAILDGILFTVHEHTSTLTAQQIPAAPNGTTYPLIANVSTVPTGLTFNGTFAAAEILLSTPTTVFPQPLIYVSNRNLGPEFDPRGDSIAIFEFVNSTTGSATATAGSPSTSASASVSARRRAHARHLDARGVRPSTHAAEVTDDEDADLEDCDDGEATVAGSVSGELRLVSQVFTGLQQIRGMSLGRVVDGGDAYIAAGANTNGGVAVFERVDGGRNLTLVARNTEVQNRTSFIFI